VDSGDQVVEAMRLNPKNVRFADLQRACERYFGPPRQRATSHPVFKTPWPGDPRANIQSEKGRAKPYEVRQVLKAIDKLQGGTP
jgi:hypothetical protein